MVHASPAESQWTSVSGRAPGLSGLSCHVELYVAGAPAGVLAIKDAGEVCVIESGQAAALIAVDSHETLLGMLRGDLPPIVAHLQGLLRFEGDADLALRILFGLQEGSPWGADREGAAS